MYLSEGEGEAACEGALEVDQDQVLVLMGLGQVALCFCACPRTQSKARSDLRWSCWVRRSALNVAISMVASSWAFARTTAVWSCTVNHSACSIYHQTHISPNTICNIHKKHHPNLQKSTRGHPKILSPIDLHHSTQLLTSGQVDTAPQLAHNLQEIKGRSVSA